MLAVLLAVYLGAFTIILVAVGLAVRPRKEEME